MKKKKKNKMIKKNWIGVKNISMFFFFFCKANENVNFASNVF